MAITRSIADSALMLPSPPRPHRGASPCVCASVANCQLSHSSDSTTKGSAMREISRRTSRTMEPLMSSSTTAPHMSVASTDQYPAVNPPDCRPMATVASRMMTSSNAPQPSSWRTLSTMGSPANRRP